MCVLIGKSSSSPIVQHEGKVVRLRLIPLNYLNRWIKTHETYLLLSFCFLMDDSDIKRLGEILITAEEEEELNTPDEHDHTETSTHQSYVTILKEGDIRSRMKEEVQRVSNTYSISKDDATLLLAHFRWYCLITFLHFLFLKKPILISCFFKFYLISGMILNFIRTGLITLKLLEKASEYLSWRDHLIYLLTTKM